MNPTINCNKCGTLVYKMLSRKGLCFFCYMNKLERLNSKIKESKRELAQKLIEEIGANGPENLEDTVARAIQIIKDQREEIKKLEDDSDFEHGFFDCSK